MITGDNMSIYLPKMDKENVMFRNIYTIEPFIQSLESELSDVPYRIFIITNELLSEEINNIPNLHVIPIKYLTNVLEEHIEEVHYRRNGTHSKSEKIFIIFHNVDDYLYESGIDSYVLEEQLEDILNYTDLVNYNFIVFSDTYMDGILSNDTLNLFEYYK